MSWGKKIHKAGQAPSDRDRKGPNEARRGGSGGIRIPVMKIVWIIVFLILFFVIFGFLNTFIGQPLVVFAWLWGIDQGWVLISMLGITLALIVILYLVVLGSLRGSRRSTRRSR